MARDTIERWKTSA